MATHAVSKYKIPVFWDDQFKSLSYTQEPFNDPAKSLEWKTLGFKNVSTVHMCDMRGSQPKWNQQFINIFNQLGWLDVGTSYYRMDAGTILPTHQDLYRRYVDVFDLQGKEHSIRRAIVFLEDWQPGHYAEYQDQAYVNWKAGSVVEWKYDTPHMAANLGSTPRYTLQITGHVDD